MKLLCYVDQAECIRRGIDAPSSTVKIEVNPALLTQKGRDFLAANVDEKLRFPEPIAQSMKADSREGICPPTLAGFLDYVQRKINDRAIDIRAAVKRDWELLVRSALGAVGYAEDPSRSNPDTFTEILMEIESEKLLPPNLIHSIKNLQIVARKAFNHSDYSHNLSEEEAEKFMNLCGTVRADLAPTLAYSMVPAAYPLPDEAFARFNHRQISFENLREGQMLLSGIGVLDIQRHAGRGRADIVVNQSYGTYSIERRIYLGQELFGRIQERDQRLFLDGKNS
jgi:hypothetical protein